MEILKWLDEQDWVLNYEVQDFRQLDSGLYYRLKITFVDQTVLFIREYVDEIERTYAFPGKIKMMIGQYSLAESTGY